MVREAGVEPARPCEHRHLKPASLPIPPLAHPYVRAVLFSAGCIIPQCFSNVNLFLAGNKKSEQAFQLAPMVREAGVEPARPCEHRHLKPASLPIPPLAHPYVRAVLFSARCMIAHLFFNVNTFPEIFLFCFFGTHFPHLSSKKRLDSRPAPMLP